MPDKEEIKLTCPLLKADCLKERCAFWIQPDPPTRIYVPFEGVAEAKAYCAITRLGD